MHVRGEPSQFLLRCGVFRSGGVKYGRGAIRFATRQAGRRFRMRGMFLFFLGGSLREKIRGTGEGETQTE